jgi:pimeloyl-ACP methyl ester carboxylesterase
VLDVANLITWEDLSDVGLVGHSYGGAVVRHVADRMPNRIRTLVYLDAFIPENGRSVIGYSPDGGEGYRKLAQSQGDGWKIPPVPASFFGVNAADTAWVDAQCTMHPLSTIETPARLTGACDSLADIGYIRASGFNGPFRQFDNKAAEHGWWRESLRCGHDVMVDMPEELTALLLKHRYR